MAAYYCTGGFAWWMV